MADREYSRINILRCFIFILEGVINFLSNNFFLFPCFHNMLKHLKAVRLWHML